MTLYLNCNIQNNISALVASIMDKSSNLSASSEELSATVQEITASVEEVNSRLDVLSNKALDDSHKSNEIQVKAANI